MKFSLNQEDMHVGKSSNSGIQSWNLSWLLLFWGKNVEVIKAVSFTAQNLPERR